jgi:hypothetical protein
MGRMLSLRRRLLALGSPRVMPDPIVFDFTEKKVYRVPRSSGDASDLLRDLMRAVIAMKDKLARRRVRLTVGGTPPPRSRT